MLSLALLALVMSTPPTMNVDGLYVGHLVGKTTEVTIEIRGTSLVILDPVSIAVMSVDAWTQTGAGKGGDLVLRTAGKILGAAARSGQMKVPPTIDTTTLNMRWWPSHKAAMLCAADPRAHGTSPYNVPPIGAEKSPMPTVSCFDVTLVWQPTVSSPEPDFECMRECRAHNQMRAVGEQVIEADCSKTCSRP